MTCDSPSIPTDHPNVLWHDNQYTPYLGMPIISNSKLCKLDHVKASNFNFNRLSILYRAIGNSEILCHNKDAHYIDVIMGAMASQITSLTIVYSTVYSGADQRKHQSSASLAFVREIHRWLVNSLHKWPVTRKMFPRTNFLILVPVSHDKELQEFKEIVPKG